ncbi:MAG: hypothetical protein JW940_13950 [Polyangiaceae bacterium]|nr:hypothetical protein [Polyangiaceae bacterium]
MSSQLWTSAPKLVSLPLAVDSNTGGDQESSANHAVQLTALLSMDDWSCVPQEGSAYPIVSVGSSVK